MTTPRFAALFALTFASVGVAAACTTTDAEPPGNSSDPNPDAAPPGSACSLPSECRTGVCTAGSCQTATNTDGVKNGDETDVDCGGPAGPACGGGKGCTQPSDCVSGVCDEGICGGLPGGDCGGPDPSSPRCADGKDCLAKTDCISNVCEGGKCKAPTSTDGEQNGTETGVDCGGPDPGTPRCPVDQGCNGAGDGETDICDPVTKKCKGPSFSDGIKNGTETDVDCGGPAVGPRCDAGKTCAVDADCKSDGCTFEKKCATHPSCTKLEGGFTCGPNEGMTKQQDCCASAKVGAVEVDKYLITAGRMRTFLERLNGNVRAWAATQPAGKWNQAYTPQLPQSWDEANTQLGPFYGKRSCDTGVAPAGYSNGHIFWTPPSFGDTKDFSKEVLDTKALNCVPWWLMAAFCVWDGGHLATRAELQTAYTNNSGQNPQTVAVYPWGAVGAYTTGGQNDYAIQQFSYATPNTPATARRNGVDFLDIAYYIAPPGRRPLGYNATGHADLVGNLLEWVGDLDRQFVWKGSWERHSSEGDAYSSAANQPWTATNGAGAVWRWGTNIGTGRPDDCTGPICSMGYYGLGGRCAR